MSDVKPAGAQGLSAAEPRVSGRSAITPFYVMEMMKAAQARQATHGDVLSLCVGQPGTPAATGVRAAAATALARGPLGYTEPRGSSVLREAVAADYRRAYDVGVDPATVLITNGSSGAMTNLLLAALDPGARVGLASPGYPAYRGAIAALGLELVDIPCGPQTAFQPTIAELDRSGSGLDALIVASPANPTGTMISAAELAALARWCDRNGVLLISDEIYHGITFGTRCASALEFSDTAVVIGSVSKYHCMTGWRLGWAIAPPVLYRRAEVLQANLAICAPAISQEAALAAFTPRARAEMDVHVDRYRRNRDLLISRQDDVGLRVCVEPTGAFYAYCDASEHTHDSLRWCAQLLDETGVALAPGIDFDTERGHRFVRVSLCGPTEDLHDALDRLAAHRS